MKKMWRDVVLQEFGEDINGNMTVWSWQYQPKKDGTVGKRTSWLPIQYSHVKYCSKCGKAGSKNRIQMWGIWESDGHTKQMRDVLGKATNHDDMCLSCANKIRPLLKARRNFIEVASLINKVKRTIKEQNHGN